MSHFLLASWLGRRKRDKYKLKLVISMYSCTSDLRD